MRWLVAIAIAITAGAARADDLVCTDIQTDDDAQLFCESYAPYCHYSAFGFGPACPPWPPWATQLYPSSNFDPYCGVVQPGSNLAKAFIDFRGSEDFSSLTAFLLVESFHRWNSGAVLPDDSLLVSAELRVSVQGIFDSTAHPSAVGGDWHNVANWPIVAPNSPNPGDGTVTVAGTAFAPVGLGAIITALGGGIPDPLGTQFCAPFGGLPVCAQEYAFPLLNLSNISLTGETAMRVLLNSGAPTALCDAGECTGFQPPPPVQRDNVFSRFLYDAESGLGHRPVLHVCRLAANPASTATLTPSATGTPTPTVTGTVPTALPTLTSTHTPSATATPTPTGTPKVRCVTFTATPATPTPGTPTTATVTPTVTPVPACPECGPLPIAFRCLGPYGLCTPHGKITNNLGLCEPYRGEQPWLYSLNRNADQFSWLFPECTLEVGHGGTGSDHIPVTSDLLVGAGGIYGALPVGVDGGFLRIVGGTEAYAVSAIDLSPGQPAIINCDEAGEIGRLALDTVAHRLCLCEGQLHWVCKGVTD